MEKSVLGKCTTISPPSLNRGGVSLLRSQPDISPEQINTELMASIGHCIALLASSAPIPNLIDDAFLKARFEAVLTNNPITFIEFGKRTLDLSLLAQFPLGERRYLHCYKESMAKIYEILTMVKGVWEKNESSCLRSHIAKWMALGGVSEFAYQLFHSPVRMQTGISDIDIAAEIVHLKRLVHLHHESFLASNGVCNSNAQSNLVISTEKAWKDCEHLLPTEVARSQLFVKNTVAYMKGEDPTVAATLLPTSANSTTANSFSLFGQDPASDQRDKALENIAQFLGITDSSVPQLAKGITNNGVKMPGLITPFGGRNVISKHYPAHPNTPEVSPTNHSTASAGSGNHRGGRGGFRGSFRGRGGGRGGLQGGNEGGSNGENANTQE